MEENPNPKSNPKNQRICGFDKSSSQILPTSARESSFVPAQLRGLMGESLSPQPSTLLWNKNFLCIFPSHTERGGSWLCKDEFERREEKSSNVSLGGDAITEVQRLVKIKENIVKKAEIGRAVKGS